MIDQGYYFHDNAEFITEIQIMKERREQEMKPML
jgi:hypothetical protein